MDQQHPTSFSTLVAARRNDYARYSRPQLEAFLGAHDAPPTLHMPAEYVRALRAYTQSSMNEFGEYAGSSKKMVHHIESGRVLPDAAWVESLRDHLPLLPTLREKIADHLGRLIEDQRLQRMLEGSKPGHMLNRLPPECWRTILARDDAAHPLTVATQGDYLRAYRNLHGLKPKDVAEAIGRSVQNVTGTENGHPEHRAYEMLADYYERLNLTPALDRARFEALDRAPSPWTHRSCDAQPFPDRSGRH